MTGLFEQFISTDNLILAFKRIAAKKAGGGIDGVSIEALVIAWSKILKGSSRRL